MANKIGVRLQDGQMITYQTYFQDDREIAAEIKRQFPSAAGWQREARVSTAGKRWLVATMILTLMLSGFYFRDVIYTEIQIQVLRYQMKRGIVNMLRQQSMIMPTPTLIPGTKRTDVGLLSSEQRIRLGTAEVIGEVQNFGHRAYDSIIVQVTFYDERGNKLETEFVSVEPNILEPGEKGRFAAVTADRKRLVRYHQALVVE